MSEFEESRSEAEAVEVDEAAGETESAPAAETESSAGVAELELASADLSEQPASAASVPVPDPVEPDTQNSLPFILEAISVLDLAMQKRFDQIQATFEREVRAESTREKVVDRLHAELQEYKNDLLLNTLKPVFIDLIQLHDDIGKIVAAHGGTNSTADPAQLIELMRGFQQGIEDILYRQGVEPYQSTEESFDPRRQRAFATVANDDPALGKRVAERLRKGFQAGEKIIRPEIVAVYAVPKPPADGG
ncbi:MAG: nucleotide exchange factor GrpE [Isosphaeraceae bacterium]|nr:nucleotide exchange factor GrpE [Isosphaeraceae bacterium]